MKENNEILQIIVAENSPIIQNGLVTLLRRIMSFHIHPIEVDSKNSLENMLTIRSIDLLFVSPNFNGRFDIKLFNQKYPELPCVAIVSDVNHINECKSYSEFITIFDSLDKLSDLIKKIIIKKNRNRSKSDSTLEDTNLNLLSNREKEILVCLAKGFSNKDIADKLCLSVYTVMTHRRNICNKLKIHSIAGLTIYAIANKLVNVEKLR